MTLYILIEDSEKYRQAINGICQKVGINDYYILDPKHDSINKPFHYLIIFGEKLMANGAKIWRFTNPPSSGLSIEKKLEIMDTFKKIKIVLDTEKETQIKITPDDIPGIKDLYTFLNEKQGQVVQVKLPDHRLVGIYPDDNKLLGQYDIEYHASTAVNIRKLIDIFGATEVMIKEV